jgi:hypothetical protein
LQKPPLIGPAAALDDLLPLFDHAQEVNVVALIASPVPFIGPRWLPQRLHGISLIFRNPLRHRERPWKPAGLLWSCRRIQSKTTSIRPTSPAARADMISDRATVAHGKWMARAPWTTPAPRPTPFRNLDDHAVPRCDQHRRDGSTGGGRQPEGQGNAQKNSHHCFSK